MQHTHLTLMGFLDPGGVVQAFMGGDNNFVHNILSDCFHAGKLY